VNERDQVSLERIVKNVLSGIGDASLGKVINAMSVMEDAEPLKNADLPEVLSGKAKNSFTRLTNFIKTTSPDLSPAEIIKKVIAYFDFDSLLRDGTPQGEERIENLDVLTGNAMQYETLADFLADASLMSSADESVSNNSVTLMTMHAAKGLEFPVVFMVGMEDGLFPSARADDEASLEEERRLAYVGMTRAMKKLFLTYAASRLSFGGRSYSMPSRFLLELGYNPYGSNQYNDAYDDDNDGFKDYYDEFPDDDLPVYE
jgi:DNA helicase-2/ATP-dependent DNA helicase PcrA